MGTRPQICVYEFPAACTTRFVIMWEVFHFFHTIPRHVVESCGKYLQGSDRTVEGFNSKRPYKAHTLRLFRRAAMLSSQGSIAKQDFLGYVEKRELGALGSTPGSLTRSQFCDSRSF